MDFIDALLLGLVEGITEFLPISSTGHLILSSHFLNLTDEATKTFEIVIQLGAILAVVVLYFQRVLDAFRFQRFSSSPLRRFSGRFSLTCMALTTLPAVVLGLLLHDWVKAALFNPLSVSLALGVGGVIMIVLERIRPAEATPIKSLDELTYRHALIIGLAQCIALWPGMSRSGSTIIGGLLCGLDRRIAAEYSFLAAIPVMFLATGYDVAKSLNVLSLSDLPTFAIGFVVAFLSALVAVKFFISQLQRTSLAPYGVYRILLAGAVFWVLSSTT